LAPVERGEALHQHVNYTEIIAILFLLFVALVPIALTLNCIFRKPLSPLQWIFYGVAVLLVKVLWRAKLPTSFPIPDSQGAVIICNHRSSIDTCFVQVVAGPRLIHWMVAQLYGEKTFIGWFLKQCEMIPVRRRGNNTSAARAAIKLAQRGELVGMLPEGTINTTDKFMKGVRPGAVHVALKAGVPIVPCYIEGSPYHEVLWRPIFISAPTRVVVGQPIDLTEFHGSEQDERVVQRITKMCVKEIANLAGEDDFEPELVGRDWKSWQS